MELEKTNKYWKLNITWLFLILIDNFLITLLKCVADCIFRIGCIRASRTTILISAPEYLWMF